MLPYFASGNLALDFAATRRGRLTSHPTERLTDGAELGAWVLEQGLAGEPPVVSESDLARGIELREAIRRLAVAVVAGDAAASTDLALVNDAAAVPPLTMRLVALGHGESRGDVDALLSTLARSAIELLAESPSRVRECSRHDCSALFVDRSRAGSRRWCGMGSCGNRVKAAAYRQRHRQAVVDEV